MITKLYNNIIRFIFGIDIFISYSRKDTAVYAERLAIILQENKFKCYLDKWGTQPGQDLSFSLKRILRHSSLFVVLGSDKAGESNSVYKEVEEFRKTNRTIVPIDFGNIRNAKWYSILQGLALTEEDVKKLNTGEPSDLVIKRITNSFTYQRQSQRLRLVTIGTITAIVLMISLMGYSFFQLGDMRSQKKALSIINDTLSNSNSNLIINNKSLNKINDSIQNSITLLNDSLTIVAKKYVAAKKNEQVESDRAKLFFGATESITSNILHSVSRLTDEELKSHELLDSLSKIKLSKMKHKEDSINNRTLKDALNAKLKSDSLLKLKQNEK